MATLVEVNSSLDALDAQVVRLTAEVAALKAGTGAATSADLDALKGRVDGAVSALTGL